MRWIQAVAQTIEPRSGVLAFAVMFFVLATHAKAEGITAARYASAVERYGHFALGRPHEYARLIVTTDSGRSIAWELPDDEVFEDLTPRLVTLDAGEPSEMLSIVSQRDKGSRLVLIRLRNGRLEISAESPAIGTPNRWLNPVGVADLDGDGRAEIAAVTTPHIGGTLRVYRREGKKLIETAALAGFSNHMFGSFELGLSAIVSVGGSLRMLVPDTTRSRLRLIAWERGSLKEVAQCATSARVTGPIQVVSPGVVLIGTASGQQRIVLSDCPAN
jgi:hypothetical protein